MCLFVFISISSLWFFWRALFSFCYLGAKKEYWVVWERATEKQVSHDLARPHLANKSWPENYSSDFSIKCIPSMTVLNLINIRIVIIVTSPRILSTITCASRHIPDSTATCCLQIEENRLRSTAPLYMILLANVCDFVPCSVFRVLPCASALCKF